MAAANATSAELVYTGDDPMDYPEVETAIFNRMRGDCDGPYGTLLAFLTMTLSSEQMANGGLVSKFRSSPRCHTSAGPDIAILAARIAHMTVPITHIAMDLRLRVTPPRRVSQLGNKPHLKAANTRKRWPSRLSTT